MKRYIHFLLFAIMLVLFVVCYEGVLKHIIFYQEQHHLFLFSFEYVRNTVSSDGWIVLLGNFLVQFFYFPTLGGMLLALLIASLYLMLYKSFYWLTGCVDVLQVSMLPSLFFFLKSMGPDYELGILVLTWLVVAVVAFICWLLSKRLRCGLWKKGPSWSVKPLVFWGLTLLCVGVYGFISFSKFVENYNMGEHRMIMADKAMKERKWDEVLAQTEAYLRSGRNNQLMMYFRNMAMYHKGGLLEHLLDYPVPFGVQALYFPWKSDSRESEYGHYIYEELGYVNEANRWEFESMVVWGEVAPHLINLASYNILINRPKVAQRFINVLKQSAFYRQKAKELEGYMADGRVPNMRLALSNATEEKPRFANILNLGPELNYLCKEDKWNDMAFEYLLADLLLSNQLVRLIETLKDFPEYVKRLGRFPMILEEALYIYKLGVGEERFRESGLAISPQTEERFRRYYALYQRQDTRDLKQSFGRSYWYYLHFESPYGTKIITK